MNRIRARLRNTSQSWIASIILVLNLVKLAGEALLWLSFSAWRWSRSIFMASFELILEYLIPKNQPGLQSGLVLENWDS
jgi:hypothetical protein